MPLNDAAARPAGDPPKTAANFVPLSPVSFLARALKAHPTRTAVIHGDVRTDYATFVARCRRLASALRRAGVADGDTVAVLAPNIPAMLEAHFGVPLAGAVLGTINIRLDAETVAFILDHGGAKVLVVDREFAPLAERALALAAGRPLVVEVDDPLAPGGASIGGIDYEAFLAGGDPDFPFRLPADEWDTIALNYTSGTTGNPKGALYHHRGAYLNACANTLAFGLTTDSVYLWTLPMFHCNGWSHTWAVTLAGGTHVCLRRVEAGAIFDAIARHKVTHMAGAPVVLNMLIAAGEAAGTRFDHKVEVATGGAAPPSTVIARMEKMGVRITHLYGLTESFGPATSCLPQPGIEDMPLAEKAAFMARQGLNHPMMEDAVVRDPLTLEPVPADGATVGELMLRGNTVMKGYLRNAAATDEAFRGGYFRTGDLAVTHPDFYVEIKDRAKDVIISGGENISSLEVEEALYKHPDVMEAAVVARPDAKWGETPQAFVTLKAGAEPDAAALLSWCREHLAGFKCPRFVTFGPLPKTSTGKIQKFALRQQARDAASEPAGEG